MRLRRQAVDSWHTPRRGAPTLAGQRAAAAALAPALGHNRGPVDDAACRLCRAQTLLL